MAKGLPKGGTSSSGGKDMPTTPTPQSGSSTSSTTDTFTSSATDTFTRIEVDRSSSPQGLFTVSEIHADKLFENLDEPLLAPYAEFQVKFEISNESSESLFWTYVEMHRDEFSERIKSVVQNQISKIFGDDVEVCAVRFRRGSFWASVIVFFKSLVPVAKGICSFYREHVHPFLKKVYGEDYLEKAFIYTLRGMSSFLKTQWQNLKERVQRLWDIVVDNVSYALSRLRERAKRLWNHLSQELSRISKNLGEFLQFVLEAVLDMENWFKAKPEVLSSFNHQWKNDVLDVYKGFTWEYDDEFADKDLYSFVKWLKSDSYHKGLFIRKVATRCYSDYCETSDFETGRQLIRKAMKQVALSWRDAGESGYDSQEPGWA